MGYTTSFQGTIKITPELTASQIKFIQGMYGDMREWAPDEKQSEDLAWFQWELNDTLDGLKWDGGEKFYDADVKMKYIIEKCIEQYPDLRFNGIITAQGEEFDDRWKLVVKDNKVSTVEIKLKGRKVTCPRCEEDFILEDD